MDKDLKDTTIACDQCGQRVTYNVWSPSKRRGKDNWGLCRDCKNIQQDSVAYTHPVLGLIKCFPYKGQVDDLWRPLKPDGELFKPGVRMCGHSDCVNSHHVVQDVSAVVKQVFKQSNKLISLSEATTILQGKQT